MELEADTVYTQYEVKDLIRLVKNHPVLYDSSRTDFKLPDRKERVWNLVGTTLSLSVEECRKRWRTLRERYTRELKRLKFYGEQSTWEYFNEMIFLNKHIKCRSARKRLYRAPLTKDPLDDSNTGWEDLKSNSNSPQLPESPQTPDEQELAVTKADPKIDDDEDELFYIERLEDTTSNEQPPIKVAKLSHNDHSYHEVSKKIILYRCDEDGLFCESVAFSLRRLSRLNNIKAKVEIYQVLERLIENEEKTSKTIISQACNK